MGLEYGSFTTGVAEVYLRVLEDDPEVACYYLTELQLDVAPADPVDFRYPSTGLQPVALILLHSPAFSCATTKLAASHLYTWKEYFDETLRQIPDNGWSQSPYGSVYFSSHCPVDPRSPSLTRGRKLILEQNEEPGAASVRSGTSFEDPGDTTSAMPDTPTRATATKQKRASTDNASGLRAARPAASGQRPARSYRTTRLALITPSTERHQIPSSIRLI